MKQSSSQQNSFFSSLFSKRMNLRTKLILGFSLISAIASLITAAAIYTTTQRQIFENFRHRVLTSVAITALQQNGDEFEKITSENELLYEKVRLQNLNILRSDPDFVYVYTMRKDPQGIYFVVDGNELDAEGFSAYGERYLEPSPFLVENFSLMTHPIVEPEIYTDEYGSFISAYAPILTSDKRQVGVIALDIAADTIIQEQRQILIQSTGIFLVALALGIILGYFASNALTRPLAKLTQGALAIQLGNFDQHIDINTHDEIGDLAKIFNSMAGEVQNLISSLEQRVAERTTDLELSRQQSIKRANELQSINEISKIITGEQKLENLLPLITRLVSERFNFYHTGIFLIDNTNQFAVLQAANSEGGQNMLKRGHKLQVGGSSIVGYVAQSGLHRISLDVGQDAVFFNNPDLPNTRSEMALPLKLYDRTVGVLDVQSEKPGAFTDNDTNTLGILADQIAIALENARLFAKTQQALDEAQALYRQNLQEGWKTFSREKEFIGYQQSLTSGKKLTGLVESDEIQQAMNRGEALIFHADGVIQEASIVVPIKLRGQVIGNIKIKAPTKNRRWSTDEVNLVETISERLSIALENARLIQESQRQLIKEQTISEVTGKIGASINLKNVLQTAVEELGRAMPGSDVMIQFKSDNK
jgi:GAF domain-containing protein/HAMP domain-containing protein